MNHPEHMSISSGFVWSQIFGVLALLFDVIKFTRSGRAALILWGIPAGWSMVASQYCLGQPQGAVFQAMASLEGLLQAALGRDAHWHRGARFLVAGCFAGLGFFIYAPSARWWTWLPVGSYGFASLGKIFHDPRTIRMVWLFSSACTVSYAMVYHNVAMILQQMVVVSLTLWHLSRHHSGPVPPVIPSAPQIDGERT